MQHNEEKTCWNCPAALLKGNVDFRACGQSIAVIQNKISEEGLLIECTRRPELGMFEPSITFEQCPEWRETQYGYLLKDMRVMILGIDGYLGWTLALKIAKLGCRVSGIDNYLRRNAVAEKGSKSVVPIADMETRLRTAKEQHGVDIDFRELDLLDRDELAEYLREVQPEAVVHYGEIPSAPYSMVDAEHAIRTQHNNTLGTLGVLFLIKEICPEANILKLGTMGEYGTPLTGRPIFEGLFPADAVLTWRGQEWSMGGELTPRDPASFYHVSKVQDTFNVYEACKYWWLRSYDVMQGVIFGVHTEEVAAHRDLRTRLDVDEWFGTVINRFVAQAVMGIPLTVYGSGEQIRGYLALEDAMEC
ncbi:NAD-dependent epimerase/dehydratase family protein, partial [Candidatus Bathyarchaeota archaeon]|nr:NAD-dependent epimerase/dehydratase family protein [Candidatus Bathyarchaeota archaeon]